MALVLLFVKVSVMIKNGHSDHYDINSSSLTTHREQRAYMSVSFSALMCCPGVIGTIYRALGGELCILNEYLKQLLGDSAANEEVP